MTPQAWNSMADAHREATLTQVGIQALGTPRQATPQQRQQRQTMVLGMTQAFRQSTPAESGSVSEWRPARVADTVYHSAEGQRNTESVQCQVYTRCHKTTIRHNTAIPYSMTDHRDLIAYDVDGKELLVCEYKDLPANGYVFVAKGKGWTGGILWNSNHLIKVRMSPRWR